MSTRRVDADGRLHVGVSNLTKATVNPYLGSEIPNAAALGLQADKIYNLLRDPAELKKAVASFNNIQLLGKHVGVSADEPQKEHVVGTTGTDAKWVPPYIQNSLAIWDALAIAGIETEEQIELSCSYRYEAIMEPGVYEGVSYDGRMANIVGNHVALVEKGRAGPDCVVGDSVLNPKEPQIMPILKKTALSRAAADFAAKAKELAPLMAADAALKPLHALYTKMAADAKMCADKAKDGEVMEAEDEMDLDPEDKADDKKAKDKKAKDASGEKEDDEEEENDEAEDKKAKDKRAKDKKAKDAEGENKKDEEDDEGKAAKKVKPASDKKAMDADIRASLRATAAAAALVRPLVGEIDAFAFDSADAIHRFALKGAGITVPDDANGSGLRLAVDMAIAGKKAGSAPVKFANDSSGPSSFLAAAIQKRG